ncbi:MAG TPA: CvpA family protein [Candidatus Dormibacteraeota bacterium]|nr:CvpA family protein [Candidatus Dormibacteraeota bacterium]
MEQIQPFDLVIALILLAMFIVGYAQGVVRRLLGIAAILFSLILGAQLRQPLGDYLSHQWTTIVPTYSYMVAFGAVFVAAAVTLSIGIQISYRPAPLFPRYPVLDETLGGLLGVVEGFLILVAILLILDPYFTQPDIRDKAGIGEFGLLRSLHDLLDNTLTASILRHNVIPGFLVVFGILIPQDVRSVFARALTALA